MLDAPAPNPGNLLEDLLRASPVAVAAHPRAEAHRMGLYFMASRGALVADRLV